MILSSAVLFTILCVFAAADEDKYTNRFDTIDIDKVLNSDRLLDNYHKCLMGRGPCTPAGAELKRHLPEALSSDCDKCTPTQREKSNKVTKFLLNKKPKMFKELEAKYDPNGVYRVREEARKAKSGSAR